MMRRVLPFIPALLLAACAVGPDYQAPAAPPKTALAPPPKLPDQGLLAGRDIPADWWALFRSPALDGLVREAMAHNADVAAAQAALRVARENAYANAGSFLPAIDASFQATRQKDPTGTVAPTAANNAPQLNLFTPQLSVSYSPDLWGGTRRGQEALDATTEGQRFQVEATYLTLTSNVVVAAVTEASLRGQIDATRSIIADAGKALAILRRQRDLGQVSAADVAAGETALAQAEQTLPPLEKQLEQQRHQLNALLGRMPADPTPETFQLGDLALPGELPYSLPARLVEQRPDIRLAAANLHVASANVGVAVANRLPNLTLSGAAGSSASALNSLFTAGNGFWNFGASLTQPVFEGFSLAHKEKAARAALDQAAAQYRSTVVLAFQNVADTLSALKSDGDALAAAQRADAAAAHALDLARRQLALGAAAPSAVLAAQQAAAQARMALVQAQATRLMDTAALFQALGGGWWNVPPAQEGDEPGHAAPPDGGFITR
ncbi:efflux transporter outer membrane subunit [Nitrospirillum viridazoti]|uniref:Histidine kinase n=1 Tax=Nitrospirillum viridazoti CBAmc TaxID=1441467 RepID=A0A248JVR9_9PROT|nr:efflux transporter outer membrane subunit [Nitrospirillum amazonense]ASG22679.1 histidine kinase [Nitrospirillum amazonense CBAmc]TWB30192.1 NodT family efflux transporter outer membrane factor (OMF) lipoprotein [Nitrospirillum amazonense]